MPSQQSPRPSPAPADRNPWLPQAAVGLAAIVGGVALMGLPLDRSWGLAVNEGLGEWPAFWSFLTWSGLGVCGFLLLTACSATEPRRVAGMLVALVVGGLLVHTLKRSLQVERPLAVFGADHPVFQVIGEALHKGSMPSGHSATVWAVAGLLALREGAASWWRHAWWALASLQALSRIVVGAHWPSDVLVGSGIGLLLSVGVWHLGVTARLGRWLGGPVVRLCVAGLLPPLAVALCWADLGWALPPGVQLGVMALGVWGGWRWWRQAVANQSGQGAT
ncbi:MAG: phosphatase PAP2 family protein [Burkholderiales bacterium]|nr:phosphatase PAP2 family protein [Burkholderiales bacterium]